ncbi:MAG: glycerol kinase GlpK [Bryobacterales bacterium]|nr:glycerol kinase GlpK [Bryobacterales bacterium]
MPYILALDQGTTSSRAIVFDHDGNILASAQKEFTQHYPRPAWVEHDPHEIWVSQIGTAAEAVAGARIRPDEIAAVGITNQRETAVVWDRRTGEAIHNAIVWQDRRTAPLCRRLVEEGCEAMIQERTGLVIDAYFSASKVAWLLENVPGARQRAERGELAFGTVDTWLLWKLTGGRCHATDASNASRTMLFNIHTGAWDPELLRLFGVPAALLPEVRSSSEVYGTTAPLPGLGEAPVAGIAGDQQAALFGQACLSPGLTKCTYGTGCFVLQNTGTSPVNSGQRLLTTVASRIGGTTAYALEGSVFIGGAVVQWVRDGLGLIRSAEEIEALARSVPDNGGVFLVPAFAGLGAPHWDPYARGAVLGITRGVTSAHLARAALESIAYQVADLLQAMRDDSGIELKELRVDGGASRNDLLMQFQADLLGAPVVRPAITETTALGAAYLAGLATGYWSGTKDVAAHWRVDRRFDPSMPAEQAGRLKARWKRALERARHWETE